MRSEFKYSSMTKNLIKTTVIKSFNKWKPARVLQQMNGYWNVVHIHNGIWFKYKEEWSHEICRIMSRSGKYYTEWSNPSQKKTSVTYSTLYKFLE